MTKNFKGIEFNVETLEVNGNKCKSKSEMFKTLYDLGMEICEVSRETGSHYSFVYGVISNSRTIAPVVKETKSDVIRELYKSGLTCSQIAKQTDSHYSFVFGVIKRFKATMEEVEETAADVVEDETVLEVAEKVDRYIRHKKNGNKYEVVEANDDHWIISDPEGKEKQVKVSTIKRYYEELQ